MLQENPPHLCCKANVTDKALASGLKLDIVLSGMYLLISLPGIVKPSACQHYGLSMEAYVLNVIVLAYSTPRLLRQESLNGSAGVQIEALDQRSCQEQQRCRALNCGGGSSLGKMKASPAIIARTGRTAVNKTSRFDQAICRSSNRPFYV